MCWLTWCHGRATDGMWVSGHLLSRGWRGQGLWLGWKQPIPSPPVLPASLLAPSAPVPAGQMGRLSSTEGFTDYFRFAPFHLFSPPLFSSQNSLAAHKRNRLDSNTVYFFFFNYTFTEKKQWLSCSVVTGWMNCSSRCGTAGTISSHAVKLIQELMFLVS